MSFLSLQRLPLAAAWGAIALAGLAAGWFAQRARDAAMRERLMEDARRSVVAIETDWLARLAGTPADADTPDYAALKARLQQLAAVDPAVRFVYVFRAPGGERPVVFLADSAPRGSQDESQPGDVYAEAAESPGLQRILADGRPATEGPLDDEFGRWVTGYAPLGPRESGQPVHVLGLDIDAADWAQDLWAAGLQAAVLAWVGLGLPLLAVVIVRRQGEQRAAIRNLSEAMEQSHSAIVILDLGGRIEYANRGLCQQLGYTRRDLIGRKWSEFHLPAAPDRPAGDVLATARSGRAWEGEWSNRRKDGTTFPARGVISPVKRRDGALSCFVAVFDNVTEAKQREAELREARDLAEAGDRAKGHFLATMSHEVRTPLNGIVGFSNLLLDTALTPEQRDYVQTIRVSTEALIQLTGDILDFARIESGKLKLDPLACDPAECVEDALDLLAAKAAEKRLELLHGIGDDVPAAVVIDGGRLRQVLVNLIGNAVKFTAEGEVEVRVTRRRDLEKADEPKLAVLQFAVRDTGIGIAPEHHAKLFRPFTQVDESTTRRYGGTGLGLAISRNLVELMGGEIRFESAAGAGSTFSFTLRAPIAVAERPPRRLPGWKVGLAVAGAPVRRELAELLRGWGLEVAEAATPAELAGQSCRLTVIDLNEDRARELAAQPPRDGWVPEKTIGLVPLALPNDVRSALRAHCGLLVNRPVHREAFFALLAGNQGSGRNPVPMERFGFRVLAVEDNRVNQRLVSRVLENLGCTVELAGNGREAIEVLAARAQEFDLVLLDLHMPEMDGLSALREIRRGRCGPRAQAMWIIALTADAREEERARGIATGLNDYLTKPLSIVDLENALKRFRADWMERKR